MTTTTKAKDIYLIPVENEARLREKFEALAKRAKKLGFDEIGFEIVGRTTQTETQYNLDGSPFEVTRHFLEISVFGPAPRIEGYELVAVLEHLGEAGNVIRAIPTAELADDELAAFRATDPGRCDHCNVRRLRKDTFVIRDEVGALHQVGRTCLRDFTGNDSPEKIAALAELLSQMTTFFNPDSEFYGVVAGAEIADLEDFLAAAAACVRVDGYLGRTAARDRGLDGCTADDAMDVLFAKRTKDNAEFLARRSPTQADKDRAGALLGHARAMLAEKAETGLSDYESNLAVVVRHGTVDQRRAGYAASILPFADRDIERRKRETRQPSRHVGEVKRRETFEVILDRVQGLGECPYSGAEKYLYKFLANKRDVIVWFTTTDLDLDPGVELKIKATVKKHDDFRGSKQTIVNRVKVL